jgi:O-antigen ligase
LPYSLLLLAGLPLIWLIPQHYLPWLTAHQDFAALALITGAGLLSRSGQALPRAWAIAIGVAIFSVVLQLLLGPISFSGDAWMTALYLLAFAGAIAVGHASGTLAQGKASWLDLLALGITVAAVLSVAVALMQWTSTGSIPLPVNLLARGDRPYANFAQANNFCTALFLGLCALCWLRESRRIGAIGWTLAAALLLLGMAMSGSRTGWLQLAIASALVGWAGRRTVSPQVRFVHALALFASFIALALLWPAVNEALLLTGNRSLSDQTQAGLRLPIWQMAIDAISRRPLWGYGWQQIGSAQWAVALDHAPLQRYIDYSHNLVLDLVLWAGLPVGGLIAALAGWALYRQARSVNDARALWLFAGVLGFFVHALLEMPHAYAYLLLPAGIGIGLVHALCPGQPSIHLRPALALAAWLAVGAAVVITAIDYFKVEQNYRTARLESAFGDQRIVTPPPDLQVLSQLGAFMRLIRTEARPGMTAADLDAMRAVTRRYPHPPALLRLALAEGLNGHPDAARDTLQRLCAMHLAARCGESRASWQALQAQYPVLAAVPAPVVPRAFDPVAANP